MEKHEENEEEIPERKVLVEFRLGIHFTDQNSEYILVWVK